MFTGQNIRQLMIWIGVILLQLILAQGGVFLFSFLVPDIEAFQTMHPALWVGVLGISFALGVFMAGWLAIQRRWLVLKPALLPRLAGALVGAYLPLLLGLILVGALLAGSPFFAISILASLLGFYLPNLLTIPKIA